MKCSAVWDITLCSPLKLIRSFARVFRFHFQGRRISQAVFTLLSCLAYFSNLKMEATCSSETYVDFQRITRRYIPELGVDWRIILKFILNVESVMLWGHVATGRPLWTGQEISWEVDQLLTSVEGGISSVKLATCYSNDVYSMIMRKGVHVPPSACMQRFWADFGENSYKRYGIEGHSEPMLLISYRWYYQHESDRHVGDAVGGAEIEVTLGAWHLLTCSSRPYRALIVPGYRGRAWGQCPLRHDIQYSDSPRAEGWGSYPVSTCLHNIHHGPGTYWAIGDRQHIAKDMRARICGAILPRQL
jgi:hypothetical protein